MRLVLVVLIDFALKRNAMKRFAFLICSVVIAFVSSQSLISCPFFFENDGNQDVLIVDRSSNLELLVPAHQKKQIPGAVLEEPNIVWVYVKEGRSASRNGVSNTFVNTYGIVEHHCIEEGQPLPIITFSTLAQRVGTRKINEGFEIVSHNMLKHMDVPRTIIHEERMAVR